MSAAPIARFRFALGTRRLVFEALRALKAAETPDEAVGAAFSKASRELRIEPVQVRSEVARFLEIAREATPRRVLEIGTSNGGTLHLLTWASAQDARILSLDLKEFPDDRLRLYESFGRRRQSVVVRRANSLDEETRDDVQQFFDASPLDLLFIDGDHAYESVRRDYELYEPLVRPGGLIALHDIVDGTETKVGGVPRFWQEVKSSLVEPIEIVESWTQGGFGIGVGRKSPTGKR